MNISDYEKVKKAVVALISDTIVRVNHDHYYGMQCMLEPDGDKSFFDGTEYLADSLVSAIKDDDLLEYLSFEGK